MRILFLIMFVFALFGVLYGLALMSEGPVSRESGGSILIASVIYIGAFVIAYVLDNSGTFRRK